MGAAAGQAPEVLVVGAGVVGASVAWHLAARGADAVVLDAGAGPGAGSTARATGGFRHQFATAPNVRLSVLARERLRRFADDTGGDAGFRAVGYLFLAHDAAALAAFRAARAVQHACGVADAAELTPEAAAALNPHVDLDGAVGAAWCPSDGTFRPMQILRRYLDDAERRGARVRWEARVSRVERDAGGRVTRVHAGAESWAPRVVVNAAGPWAAGVAALCGVDLPVRPVRRQIAVTAPVPAPLDDGFPMTIWTRDAFHLRVRDGRALLNWPVDTPGAGGDPWDLTLHRPWLDAVRAFADARVPALRGVPLDDAAHWVGLYEMSPDKTLILGVDPACPNLVLANGSSGHGVMHAPATGLLASELALDGRATTLDARPFRPTRFAEGEAFPVSDLL
ncbi:FAD-dependent oxidoreductase [Roseisolibacter sp. H3M3-2]|uniref:NAD(P)/FAD-dependent oxidoreductase n=1 Tax=Roseisolibacter sp. H3M3-2 TaxID=3031323 RepID=UPI0023DC8B1C|nr:FAD-dependent oxidoreductase [Roseisolibacter sp. H3M3-2]MDF1503253.1 FAD-dependent oxidoreductase [Roseisolibacter sp. H3M3-2]